jgi:hypothetical protein
MNTTLRFNVRLPYAFLAFVLAEFLVLASSCGLAFAQNATVGTTQDQAPQFRVIRSVTGSKGVPHDNDLTITDPKTVFHVPEDKQVIVFFEWEGPTGLHHFQGTWRSPDGKAFSVSDFQYVAQETRFRGYWTLTLPEAVPSGLWALEAQIDGQQAGTQTFQIIAPDPPPSAATIYQRVVAASVFIDSLDADGQVFSQGSGFFVAPGYVITAFQIIDGASTLQVRLPNGTRVTLDQATAWSRWEDWALLKIDGANIQPLEFAKSTDYKVGDVCYAFDAPQGDSRTIQNVQITGVQSDPKAGKRMSLSWNGMLRSIGSPVLDNQGQVIGLLAAGIVPGEANVFRSMTAAPYSAIVSSRSDPFLVTPITKVVVGTDASQTSLADIAKRGTFIPPMAHTRYLLSGALCKDFKMVEGATEIIPVEETREFSKNKGTMAVVVSWMESGKVHTTEELHFYDADNHEVAQSKPRKLNLDANRITSTGWKTDVATFPVGIYRVDVVADGKVQWRTFFKITE